MKNLFFDFDGTVADTQEGIINALKYMVSELNLKILVSRLTKNSSVLLYQTVWKDTIPIWTKPIIKQLSKLTNLSITPKAFINLNSIQE
jgi:Predicted phosphatases